MIIKGGAACNIAYWSRHLMRDDTNDAVELLEIDGTVSRKLSGALTEMAAIASASRCQRNFMYQANINPRIGEVLTRAQAIEAFDVLGRNLGLDGHQRVIVQHEKAGRRHFHAIWNRVDIETLKVTDIGGNYRVHEATARELEARFGLELTPRPAGRRARSPELWEQRAAERSGIKIDAVKAEVTRLWQATDSGKSFRAALEGAGYILARGDRRDFCIVDRAGTAHSLARRLDGVRTKELRARMADIDRDRLPSVAEARVMQRRRAAGHGVEVRTPRVQALRSTARQAFVRRRNLAAGRLPKPAPFRRGYQRPQGPPPRLRGPTKIPTSTASHPKTAWRAAAVCTLRRAERGVEGSWGPAVAVTTGRSGCGRAEAAYAHAFAVWQALIDAVRLDSGLSPNQRDAAILSLRQQQQVEAEGARRRVLEEGAQTAAVERRRKRTRRMARRIDGLAR